MKKIVLVLATVFLLTSCSSDDTESKEVKLTYQNMAGRWIIESVLKADGTKVPYAAFCATKNDYFDFYSTRYMDARMHYNCEDTPGDAGGCSSFFLYEDTRMLENCTTMFDGKVVSLTKETMHIKYSQERYVGLTGLMGTEIFLRRIEK
ncbi:hypothetical protein [Flavobacterium sp. GCM10023249]|uniref:hypothetical protein n=1 Tax=unclassified Flavobacterium TaxID=196869 RepID=UPI00361686F3